MIEVAADDPSRQAARARAAPEVTLMTTDGPGSQTIHLHTVTAADRREAHTVELPDYERERFDDIAFMTAMNLCLMGNYAQTGHYGGPLACTPYNVACHLAGPALGGTALRPA